LKSIAHPTLVVHGNKDIVVTPINAFILAEHLPNAQLIMYPDASHAAYSQYAEKLLGKCEAVSQWVGRAGRIAVQATRVTSSSLTYCRENPPCECGPSE